MMEIGHEKNMVVLVLCNPVNTGHYLLLTCDCQSRWIPMSHPYWHGHTRYTKLHGV